MEGIFFGSTGAGFWIGGEVTCAGADWAGAASAHPGLVHAGASGAAVSHPLEQPPSQVSQLFLRLKRPRSLAKQEGFSQGSQVVAQTGAGAGSQQTGAESQQFFEKMPRIRLWRRLQNVSLQADSQTGVEHSGPHDAAA